MFDDSHASFRQCSCHAPGCGVVFFVCPHGERGQVYCSDSCRQLARRIGHCIANQGTDRLISSELTAKIRRLFFAEHWKIGTIAAELSLHPDTVRGAIESHRFNLHRPPSPRATLTAPYLDFIAQTLKQYPRLRATRLYQMLRARSYTGSEVQLRRVVRSLRPQKQEAFLRLTTLAGEQAQADWAHFGQVRVGSATRKLSCFVITLSYSRALWEVGYLAYDANAADLLYEVVNRRYETGSIVMTTNCAFKDWNEVFPNATIIGTMLDRLLHHADVALIEGQSFRRRESAREAETAAPRKQR